MKDSNFNVGIDVKTVKNAVIVDTVMDIITLVSLLKWVIMSI